MDSHIAFASLGLSPIAISIGPLDIRWYSLAYIAGIIAGWWYLLRLLAQPAAPMNRAQADDLVFYATLGVILGGRLGYVIFYGPEMIFDPLQILKLWDGGMSFHGGAAGVSLALILFARRHGLEWLHALMKLSTISTATSQIRSMSGSVAKIVKLEHAWRRLDGRNDDGFQVAPFPG